MLRLVVADHPPGPPALAHPGECLVCFVERMVIEHGCGNHLQWASLWRDRAAPRATALERRLGAKGGYCDCEILMNAFVRRVDLEREIWHADECDEQDPAEDPELPPPPCLGVRRGSTQPCAHWAARNRWSR